MDKCKYKPAAGFLITEAPAKIKEEIHGLAVEESTRYFERAQVVAVAKDVEGVSVGDYVIIPSDAGQQIDSRYWCVDAEDLRAIEEA